MCKDLESKKLKIILDNLKDDYNLCVYNFKNETAIIKDENNIMFNCDLIFQNDKVLFKNIVQKKENILTIQDIKA